MENYRASLKGSFNSSFQKNPDRASVRAMSPDNKNYNRFKYYSALRTGFKHIGAEEEAIQMLEPPKHVIDQELFMMNSPFSAPSKLLFSNTL